MFDDPQLQSISWDKTSSSAAVVFNFKPDVLHHHTPRDPVITRYVTFCFRFKFWSSRNCVTADRGLDQCDQIGRFLKVLGDKSSPNY